MLTIDNRELAIVDSRPNFFRGARSQSLEHDADSLPIPFHVVYEVVDLPQHTPSLARSKHPRVRRFLALEAVHIESEVASHEPTILRVVFEVSQDPCRFRNVRVFSFLQRGWHHWRQTYLNALYHSWPLHVVPRSFGWRGLSIGPFHQPGPRRHWPRSTFGTSCPERRWFSWTPFFCWLQRPHCCTLRCSMRGRLTSSLSNVGSGRTLWKKTIQVEMFSISYNIIVCVHIGEWMYHIVQ